MDARDIEIRLLEQAELARVAEIDRTETIQVVYVQQGTQLLERVGDWSAPPWEPDGAGEHSVEARHLELLKYDAVGAFSVGAFSGDRLVGIGVVVPHLRPGIAQLAFLHVTHGFRATGIGRRLCAELERLARGAGASEIVASATPSENTVRFYLGRGYEPMAEPLPELFELEPEDVHMHKAL